MAIKKRAFLTMEEAVEAFYEIADNERLLHFVTENGCAPRAYKIDLYFKLEGLQPSMVFAFAQEDKYLVVDDDRRMQRRTDCGGWRYHVAITIPVELEGGAIANLIFDPSLFDGPVTKKQWVNKINAHAHMVRSDMTHREVKAMGNVAQEVHYLDLGGQRDFAHFQLKYKETQTHDRRVVSVSKICNHFFANRKDLRRKRFGKTWTTSRTKPHCRPKLLAEKKPKRNLFGLLRNGN